QALELAVAGVEREPALRHLHHVRDLAALHHREQLLEGLSPGQRDDVDGDAGIGLLERAHLLLQQIGALRAGDHFDQLQLAVGPGRSDREAGQQGDGTEQFLHDLPPFPVVDAVRACCRSAHKSSTSSNPICSRTSRGDTPKSRIELMPPACCSPTSAGKARLSCPPQLTPSLNMRSASQKARMLTDSASSIANSPDQPDSVARPGSLEKAGCST